jgi:cystine transport system ATP-binding protein
MVIVTHEIRFAQKVADQVIFMDHGEILERGTPEKVLGKPKNQRLKDFLEGILFS